MLRKTRFLGIYLLITFTVSYQHDQPVRVCSGTLKKISLMNGHNQKKGSFERVQLKKK